MRTGTPSQRPSRPIRDAAGTAATVAVLVAVPAVLAGWVGIPLPRGGPQAGMVSWHGLLDLLALVAWASWAVCVGALARAVTRRVRTRDVGGASRPFDRVAARIAVVLLGVASALGAGAGVAGAAASRATPNPPAVTRTSDTWDTGTAVAVHEERTVAVRDARITDGTQDGGPSGSPAPVAPALSLVGAGAIVAALVARRARQRWRVRSLARAEGSPPWIPSERAADLATAVSPFEHAPVLGRTEAAVRHLRAAVEMRTEPLPAVRWVRVADDAVEVGLASPPAWTPTGWQSTERPSFVLPASLEALRTTEPATTPRSLDPWTPLLLPLGEDRLGSWMLPLDAGTCLAVIGPSAASLVEAMRAAATRWAWHESVVVTDDPAAAAAAAPTALVPRGACAPATRVLFVGDPRDLGPAARRVCAVLTTVPLARADLTVLVDPRGATVHPIGLSVRPHLLDPCWAPALGEIDGLGSGTDDGTDDGADDRDEGDRDEADGTAANRGERGDTEGEGLRPAPPVRPLVHRRTGTTTVAVHSRSPVDRGVCSGERGASGTGDEDAALGPPGVVEVRLLTAVPAIDGLRAPLPSKRARRAVELLAYLAVHSPDPVTGDRLRTRVLGTADADAAVKTLFNVAGAARHALGAAPDGTPLFPHATRAGHYRLSPLVTVDALRMERALRAGLATPDPARAFGLLRSGLELLRGEPLDGVLAGYGWWCAEGHERRMADVVVDAACTLARTSIREGRLDLARRALDRARLVEHYSEALCRSAMEVAAAAGDAGRLHREWLECRRQVDEVDPGGVPSAPTERLYAHLRDRLTSGARVSRGTADRRTDLLV